MLRLPLVATVALTTLFATGLPAAAATIEYTFTVPYRVAGPLPGNTATGAGAARVPAMSISCAVGPAGLGYSTATNSAVGDTGRGTTQNVTGGTATVVVTVDAEPRGDIAGGSAKDGSGKVLQPKKPGGYYTCWATFASGQTPVNFLQTTPIPKSALAPDAKGTVAGWDLSTETK